MATQIGVSQQVFPVKDLISGPLEAIVEAHALLSQSTLQFISDFGLEPASSEKTAATSAQSPQAAKLRMVEFTYVHPVPDPSNPGNVIDTPVQVKVPLLAMVSLPNLKISEATLDFNIKVVGFSKVTEEERISRLQKAKPPFQVYGVYGPRAQVPEKAEQEPSTLAISIKITKEQVPDAANRILGLVQDAIISRPIKEEAPKAYLFSWDDIPGKDDGRLLEYLEKMYGFDWVRTAKIEKFDDSQTKKIGTIKISTVTKSLWLRLNDEKTKVYLKSYDGTTDEFIAKNENGKLNIYPKTNDRLAKKS